MRVSLLALASLLSTSCALAPEPELESGPAVRPVPLHHMPPPTEHWLADDAETTNKQRRKQWMRDRHLAPPEVDWKAIEVRNGERQRQKRNQLAQMNASSTGDWTERGSKNQAGRMHVAALSPDGTTLYAGSSKGGVWKADPGGTNWTPIGDNLYGGAHWMAVVSGATPSDPPVVLAATDSGLIHVTRDDGATWQVPSGPVSVTAVRRVFVPADGSEAIFMVLRSHNSGQQRYQLWRSTDAAASFQIVRGMNFWPGDAWGPRDGAGPIFAINGTGVHRTDDGGDTWAVVGSLPAGATGGELTGSEAGAPRLYAVLDMPGGEELWRSDDAGASWSYQHDVTDYWGTLAASIVDPDLVAWGGVEVWRSTNGGGSFAKVNNWYDYYNDVANKLHADIPGMDVLPGGPNGELWFISTDGGLYRSRNGMDTVQNFSLSGLRVSQYYTTLTSITDPNMIAAGAQDQGWQWSDSPPASPDSLHDFDQLISGDYGHAVSGDGTHGYVFTTYPGFILIHWGEVNPQLFSENFPSGETNAWLPPVVADPDSTTDFFFLASRLYKYEKDPSLNDWTPVQYSAQNFQISFGEYLSGLAFSPVDPNRAYAVTSAGRLWYSNDKGVTWTQSASTGPGGQYFYGTAILASSLDVDTVWVGGSGYGVPAIYRSTDGGQTFQPWDAGLPDTLVYCLGESPDLNETLFCGTETAVYRRDRGSAMWVDVTGNDAPVTTYWSVEAVEALEVMRFGTYGRGIWDYHLAGDCAYAPYGMALDGANVLTLDSASGTQIGTVHTLQTSGAPPGAFGIIAFSPYDNFAPLLGGTSLVSAQNLLYWFNTANASGVATRNFSIPASQSLVGVPVYFQSLFVDGSQPDGWALSNGLRGRLCQ